MPALLAPVHARPARIQPNETLPALLYRYGYALLFAGVMVEGEAFLLTAAALSRRGYLHLGLVIGVAVAANSVADQAYYLAARARGQDWLERRYGHRPGFQRLVAGLRRHSPWLLLGSRFAYGLRIAIPAACGALGMPHLAFTLLDLAAGLVWSLAVALSGYYGVGILATPHLLRRWEVALALAAVLGAAALVGARRVRRAWGQDVRVADLHALVPMAIGLMGVLNVVSAIAPRSAASLRGLEQWLPLEVIQGSRAVMLFAGLALLQVTANLARRKALAWWVAVVALSVSSLSHAGRGLDLHHSAVAGLLVVYLAVFRRRFHARSDPASLRFALRTAPLLVAMVMLYGGVGLFRMRHRFFWPPGATPVSEAFRAGILTVEPRALPLTPPSARLLGSLPIVGWLARFYLLVLLLRPVILRRRAEAPPEAVDRIVGAHGRHSLAAFAAQPDKHHLLVAGGRGLVAFAVRGHVALACGDPLAGEADLEAAAAAFIEHGRRNGWIPCFYDAAEERLALYRRLGLRSLKIAEEAVLELPAFSLAGGRRAALRSMVHKVRRTGREVRRYHRARAPDPDLDEQLEEVSEEWLEEKRLGEMGFTLGRFSLQALDHVPVFLCLEGDRVEAFCSWLPYRGGQAVVLDLMRRRRQALSGTMDFLLSESLLALRDEGWREASLANAPLANVGGPRRPLDRGVALLFERLNGFYGYKNLFQFKKKFDPVWEGRYLVYPRGADLPRIGYAMAAVHGTGSLLSLLWGR